MSESYTRYLRLNELLALQTPRSDPPEHDETLFIVIHQVYELWFKLLLHELDKITGDLTAGRLFDAISTFKRVRMVLKILVAQLDILETMSPLEFNSFRARLEDGSGFQSAQFRALEFLLGYKRPPMLAMHEGNESALAILRERLHAPSVVDRLYDFLELRGVEIPSELREKPSDSPTQPNAAVQDAILRIYIEEPDVRILFEMMTDVDEGLQEWRYRHVKMVERTIGDKQGTGGSPGAAFLRKSLFHAMFPDLWAIRGRV